MVRLAVSISSARCCLGHWGSWTAKSDATTLEMPLWNCSDTGCLHSHGVALQPPSEVPLVEVFSELEIAARRRLGPPSEWGGPLRRLLLGSLDFSGRDYFDLPVVLCECFTTDETRSLLERALSSDLASQLRRTLASTATHAALA